MLRRSARPRPNMFSLNLFKFMLVHHRLWCISHKPYSPRSMVIVLMVLVITSYYYLCYHLGFVTTSLLPILSKMQCYLRRHLCTKLSRVEDIKEPRLTCCFLISHVFSHFAHTTHVRY